MGVPDALGINHSHRATDAAVKAASIVHRDTAGAGQMLTLDLGLAVIKSSLGAILGAASLTVVTLIQTEK